MEKSSVSSVCYDSTLFFGLGHQGSVLCKNCVTLRLECVIYPPLSLDYIAPYLKVALYLLINFHVSIAEGVEESKILEKIHWDYILTL